DGRSSPAGCRRRPLPGQARGSRPGRPRRLTVPDPSTGPPQGLAPVRPGRASASSPVPRPGATHVAPGTTEGVPLRRRRPGALTGGRRGGPATRSGSFEAFRGDAGEEPRLIDLKPLVASLYDPLGLVVALDVEHEPAAVDLPECRPDDRVHSQRRGGQV